jgi:hypothetical protein
MPRWARAVHLDAPLPNKNSRVREKVPANTRVALMSLSSYFASAFRFHNSHGRPSVPAMEASAFFASSGSR